MHSRDAPSAQHEMHGIYIPYTASTGLDGFTMASETERTSLSRATSYGGFGIVALPACVGASQGNLANLYGQQDAGLEEQRFDPCRLTQEAAADKAHAYDVGLGGLAQSKELWPSSSFPIGFSRPPAFYLPPPGIDPDGRLSISSALLLPSLPVCLLLWRPGPNSAGSS